jgi:hypothetical protein
MTSAPARRAASSNETAVRVEASKEGQADGPAGEGGYHVPRLVGPGEAPEPLSARPCSRLRGSESS